MSVDILIEELDGSLWVAALDDGKLDGMEVDPVSEEVRWGSIYWAKVQSVDAAQDAVYVDLDGDNSGILYNRDVRIKSQDGTIVKGGEKAIGKLLTPGQMVIVQSKMAFTPKYDDDGAAEHKSPRVSMDITLPGRYLIFCPMMMKHRISQRIRDKGMREQLHTMMEVMEQPGSCILRAAAAHTQTDMLVREQKILKEAWAQMQQHFLGNNPQLIMLGPDGIQRTLSDHATQQIDSIEIVIMDHYTQVEEWCSIFAPDLVPKIKPIELENAVDDLALFEHRDIVGQIEALSQAYVMLPSGGNIIIQETAALTAVDVNRGAHKGAHLAINIEAARELARQIRLRNAGGIVIVDFLKMNGKKEKDALLLALEQAVNEDPCTVQIHGMTSLGLLEITRKRRTPPLQDRMDAMPEY